MSTLPKAPPLPNGRRQTRERKQSVAELEEDDHEDDDVTLELNGALPAQPAPAVVNKPPPLPPKPKLKRQSSVVKETNRIVSSRVTQFTEPAPVAPVEPTAPQSMTQMPVAARSSGSGSRRRSAKNPATQSSSPPESPPLSPKRKSIRRPNRASMLLQKFRHKGEEEDDLVLSGPTGFAHRAHGEAGLSSCLINTSEKEKQEQLLRAVALYIFSAELSSELALEEGRELFVIATQDAADPDWWFGCSGDGAQWGFFPRNRVILL